MHSDRIAGHIKGMSTQQNGPKRQPLDAPWWTTWPSVVEVAVVENTPRGRTVQAVYADGTLVGHVVGRPEAPGKRRSWDYRLGATPPTVGDHMVFGAEERTVAVDNLLSAAKRDGLL